MNGMLQHHDIHRVVVERSQREARDLAQASALGRVARGKEGRPVPHVHAHPHSLHIRLRALRMHLRSMVSPRTMRVHHRSR